VEYDCTYKVKLIGARLAPAWIAIDWSLAVTVAGGWTVQLMPLLPNDPAPVWIDAGGAIPPILLKTGFAPDASADVTDDFNNSAALNFRVRLTRPACDLEPAALQFNLTGTASMPDHADAAITTQTEPTPEVPYLLTPTAAPVPDPTIALTGSLDFGAVGLTAVGPKQLPNPKVLTLTVTGLDQACGTWNLTMTSTTFDAATNQETSTPTLKLTAVNGDAVKNGGALLDGAKPVLAIDAGPGAAAKATYQLSIALVLPDQPALAAYNASLRVSLDAAGSKATDGAPGAPGQNGSASG
jgi:hypothetical protein